MKRVRVIPLLSLILLAILIGLPTLYFSTSPASKILKPSPTRDGSMSLGPHYEEAEIIVKFKTEGPQMLALDLEDLLDQKKAVQSAFLDNAKSLQDAFTRHKVTSAHSIFIKRKGLSSIDAKKEFSNILSKANTRAKKLPKAAIAEKNSRVLSLVNVYKLKLDENDVESAVESFKNDPHVEYAQPNYLIKTNWTPNDQYFSSGSAWGQTSGDLWGLHLIQAPNAWDYTKGEGIVVAVVDTGLDYNHPDIASKVWLNPIEDLNQNGAANGTRSCPSINGDYNCQDDDQNGYKDDIRGWNTISQSDNVFDDNGHGTHVAGTIAAATGNGIGIAGVAPAAKIMPVKALNGNGVGTSESLANAMIYAAQNGADVINNSWGCYYPCPSNPIAEDALAVVNELGSVSVFAAGNSSSDVALFSPQNVTMGKPIVVSATTDSDQPTGFTNFGRLVDVAAPGGGSNAPPPSFEPARNILSLKSAGASAGATAAGALVVGGQYLRQAGTSMAAPHVSGAAALILAIHPEFSQDDVRWVLKESSDSISAPLPIGEGRINLWRAVTTSSPSVRALITSPTIKFKPAPNATSIYITGQASGPNFKDYQLFYGKGFAPTTWNPLGGRIATSVENGTLATWSISALPTGVYTIKLVVTSNTNFQVEAYTNIVVEAPLKRMNSSIFQQRRPQISGRYIVFEDDRHEQNPQCYEQYYACNSDIFLFDRDTGREYQITNNLAPQTWPSISGNKIIWEDGRNDPFYSGNTQYFWGNTDIYWCEFDPVSGSCPNQALLIDPEAQGSPTISGDWVAWLDLRSWNPAWAEYDLRAKNLKSGEEIQITNDDFDQWAPDVSGTKIVWEDWRNGSADIYMYDLATRQERPIVTKNGHQGIPAISQDKAVWSDWSDNYKIHIYNTATNQENVIPNSYGLYPDIDGDLLVWEDYRDGILDPNAPVNADAYVYNLSTGQTTQLTADVANQFNVTVHNGTVAWQDFREGRPFIYLNENVINHDEPLGGFITSDNEYQRLPDIFGTKVVWMDYRHNGKPQIYVYDLANPATPSIRLFPTTGSQMGPAIHNNRIVWSDNVSNAPKPYVYDLTQPALGARVLANYGLNPEIYNDTVFFDGDGIWKVNLLTPSASPVRLSSSVGHQRPSLSSYGAVWTASGINFYFSNFSGPYRWIAGRSGYVSKASISGSLASIGAQVYDLTQLQPTPICLASNGCSSHDNGAIDGTRVVWRDHRGTVPQIYFRDLSNMAVLDRVVLPGFGDQETPSISGTRVVWVDYSSSESGDIRWANLNEPPKISLVSPPEVVEGSGLSFNISAQDPENSPIKLEASLSTGSPLSTVGATLVDNNNGSATFNWNPTFTQAGDYSFKVTADDGERRSWQHFTVRVTDSPLIISSPTITPNPFSPNGDGVYDTVSIKSAFSRQTERQILRITTGNSEKIFTLLGPRSSVIFTWNGRNQIGQQVPDGSYPFTITGEIFTTNESVSASGTVTVDTVKPQITNLAPLNGSTSTTRTPIFSGKLTDASEMSATLKLNGVALKSWSRISSGTTLTFQKSLSPGVNTYSIIVQDKAGNVQTAQTQFTVK